MLGMSPLGAIHTAISLVAIVAGFWAFVRDKEIALASLPGRVYLVTTALTAATGLMIFPHGFRIGHQFAIATLIVIAIGMLATATPLLGRAARYVQAVCFSSTMLIHLITGAAETLTRLPPGAPLVTAANAFLFKDIFSALTLAFLVALAFQLRWIQKHYSIDIRR